MREFVFKGVTLDYCEDSNSVWLDYGELEKIQEKSKTKKKERDTSDSITGGDVAAEVALSALDGSASALLDGAADLASETAGPVIEFLGEIVSGVFDSL